MPFSLTHLVLHRFGSRLYYGWVVVAVVLLANLVAFSINVTFGLYITPLEAEFGWSRGAISFGYALGPILGAVVAPLWGTLLDRIGVRPMMVLAGLLGATCLILMGRIQALWQLYVVYSVLFSVLYTGVAQLMGSVSVTRWFIRRRGRALGIIMMGASGGGFLFVPLQNLLINALGWRNAYTIYGLLCLLLIVLPTLLFMSNRPEDAGQQDNVELSPLPQTGRMTSGATHDNWTLREAMRTRVFWSLLAGIMLATICVAGYFTHVVPHLEHLGFSRTAASSAWSFFFFVSMFSKFAWGFISERLAVRWCLMICMVGECIGLLLLMHPTSHTQLVLYAVINGLGHGPFLQLIALVWGNYFGRGHIGSILGTVQPAIVLAGASGPLVGGLLFDQFGDYRVFLWLLVAAAAGAGLLFFLSPPPQRSLSAAHGAASTVPAEPAA
jgi:MFS family permease